MRAAAVVVGFISMSVAAAQTPLITYRGVVNAASFAPAGVPGGGIAQGALFSIFGQNLGPSTPAQQSSFPLQTTFGGVSINVSQSSGATVSAIPVYVSATQINAIMPSNAPLGLDALQVNRGGSKSNNAPVRVVNATVGIVSAGGGGNGPGVIQNFVAQDNQPLNTNAIPAKPGQVVTMWATGLGPIKGQDANLPPVGTLPTTVDVSVGGAAATVLYAGRSGCCSAEDQIVFQVPDNAPTGCWVPVYVRTGGATLSNVVTMAITSDGSPCDAGNAVARRFIQGGTVGLFSLVRMTMHQDNVVHAPVDITTDYHTEVATQEPGGAFVYSPFLSEPPPSTCTVMTGAGDYLLGDPLPWSHTAIRPLDFGALTLTGPKGSRPLKPFTPASYSGPLGSFSTAHGLASTLYLDPGNYTITGSGGAAGNFTAQITMPAPINWTNRDQNATVDRSSALTLTWSGAGNQSVAILGVNVDEPTNSSALFYCVAAPGATTFTVPAAILAALPATRANPLQSRGAIYLSNMPLVNAAPLTTSPFDAAVARGIFLTGRTVIFR